MKPNVLLLSPPGLRRGHFLARVEQAPAALCLLVMALVLWPVWAWSLARMQDGSDDPLGLVALAALLAGLWWQRQAWRGELHPAWALLAGLCTVAATTTTGMLPMLLRAVLAVFALSALLAGMARRGQALLPYFGLALLSLPLLSSLQFYAGYPLRVITAEASVWLLRFAGFVVERSGAALTIEGRLVLVDAPCSGIHMAWTAYFTACAAALIAGLPDRCFLQRLPLIGMTVIAGNILRNTVLVSREAAGGDWPDWAHATVGLVMLTLVCLLVFVLMGQRQDASLAMQAPVPMLSAHRRYAVPVKTLLLSALLGCAVLPLLQSTTIQTVPSPAETVWPRHWEGHVLQALPLSVVEARFATQFPGAIGRFSDGQRLLVLRRIHSPTRMLHPATDCYRGLGYRIAGEHLERDRHERLQRCFVAERGGRKIRVCERIADAGGQGFTDTSSWYWAAVLGRSSGPWMAVTTAEVM